MSNEKKRPLTGLIPRISPKLPDTSALFVIEWEDIQQSALELTVALTDYSTNRETMLQEE